MFARPGTCPYLYIDAPGALYRLPRPPEQRLSGFAQRFPISLPQVPVEKVSHSSGPTDARKALPFSRLYARSGEARRTGRARLPSRAYQNTEGSKSEAKPRRHTVEVMGDGECVDKGSAQVNRLAAGAAMLRPDANARPVWSADRLTGSQTRRETKRNVGRSEVETLLAEEND